ncbi:MAG: tetraacyldisaccharide 4'-kinase [Pseudomonadota bacterium]
MHAPRFWQTDGWTARLLDPLGRVYAGLGRLRWAVSTPARVAVPVICVGNATVGGTGKTPIVLDLLRRLRARGLRAHGLCRGHGGRLRGPVRVDPTRHGAREVGDEALLLAAAAPTWAARDRLAGARAAVAAGAEAIVLDDGLQYPKLAKTLSLLVVDAATGFANGRIVPAGPLREPAAAALCRSDAVIEVGDGESPGLAAAIGDRTRLRCRLVATPSSAAALRGQRVYAFAGIGRPEKFFETAARLGAEVAGSRAFPDHHPYRPGDCDAVLAAALAQDAVPLTTAKDAVRLPPTVRARVRVLDVDVAWENEAALDGLLAKGLGRH